MLAPIFDCGASLVKYSLVLRVLAKPKSTIVEIMIYGLCCEYGPIAIDYPCADPDQAGGGGSGSRPPPP